MRHSWSWINAAGMILGGIGIIVCLASMAVLWIAIARLGDVTESLFDRLDRSLIAIRERVVQAQDRVQAAKISAEDVQKSIGDWTKGEAVQRVAAKLDAEQRTERLSSILQQADRLLDVSESSVGFVQQVLSVDAAMNASAAREKVDQLLTDIVELRSQLNQAAESVNRVRERVVELSDDQPAEERTGQILQITLRVVATLGSIDSRLGRTADRVSESQIGLQEIQKKANWWICAATITVMLLILLMAAGQVALCRLAWTSFRSMKAPT
jgi:hypothetical protein